MKQQQQPQQQQQTASQQIGQIFSGGNNPGLGQSLNANKKQNPQSILKTNNQPAPSSLVPAKKPIHAQPRHQSISMKMSGLQGINKGGGGGDQPLIEKQDQADVFRREISQTLSRTTTMKRISESIASQSSNKIVPLLVAQNGRLSRATQKTAPKPGQLKKLKSNDSNGLGQKKAADMSVQELIKQIENKRKEIAAIKGKTNPQSNIQKDSKPSNMNLNDLTSKKKSSLEVTNDNRLTIGININKNRGGDGERSSSSSGSENKKSSHRNRRKTVNDKAINKNLQNQGDFLKGFQLLDKHNQKNGANGGLNSPGRGQGNNGGGFGTGAGGKMMKIKAFIDEAKQEQLDLERSSSESDASKQSEGNIISTKRNKIGFEGKSHQVDSGKEKDLVHDQEILLSNRSIKNAVAGSNNASFTAGQNFNPSMNHTINSDQNQDNSQNEEANRSKVMNFSLLDDQILKKKMPKFVINPTALWKTVWNVMGLLIILFLALTVPYRIAFENTTPDAWLYMDISTDSIFMLDVILNFFTAYEDENGELITENNKIARNYMRTWFTVDLISSIPITLIQKFTQQGGVDNIKLLKLSRLPRLYRLLRLIKLVRLYKTNKFVEKLFAAVNISVTANRMITSLIMMIFLLHLIGCLWATVASLTFGAYPSIWMSPINLVDADNIDQYVASVYWAAVTIYTVGYGDITPQNEMEMMSCVLILFTGVSLYAYMFSKLSTLFSSVNANDNNQKTRDEIIHELSIKHRFTNDLMNKIQYFFQQNSNLISLSKEYAIDELLEILPAHLKSEISYFLYRDAIETIKILQDKDQRFYGDYLSKFEPMRIKNETVFAKEGTSPQEVFFLLKGCVQCERQEKYYLEGTIFGETDIILKRNRTESYVAKSDCYILKLEASIFEQILDEFEDIREEIQQIVVEREKKRIEDLQQLKLKKEDPKIELQRLMSKINLEEMQAQRQQSYKRFGTNRSAKSNGDNLNSHQGRSNNSNSLILQTQQNNPAGQTQSSRPSLKLYANLQVETGKQYGKIGEGPNTLVKRDPSIQNIKQDSNNFNANTGSGPQPAFNTFGNMESLESGLEVNRNNAALNNSSSPRMNPKFDKNKKGGYPINPSKISPLIEKYTQQTQSPDFNYNKLLFGSNGRMLGNGNQKVSQHMLNIQNIKNNIRESMMHEEIDKNIIEERIQETKQQIRMENQMKELEKIDNMEFGYDSNRQSQNLDEFNQQLRQSLKKLQKSSEQSKIQRKATVKDKPVNAPNNFGNGDNGYENFAEEHMSTQNEEITHPAPSAANAHFKNQNLQNPTSNLQQQQQVRSRNQVMPLNDSLQNGSTLIQNTLDNFQIAANSVLNTNFNQTQIDSQRNVGTAMDMNQLQTQENMNNETQQDNYNNYTQQDMNGSVNSYFLQNLEQMEPYNPNNDPLLENDVQKLSQHIMSCLSSISNTRLLIMEYCQLFKTSIEQMGEDANEIIRQHYVQGVKCLESYLSIMNLIEKLIQSIDLQAISQKISNIQIKTNESEKRFYFLENRVKMLQEVLSRKIKMLEKQRARMLSKKPLVIVKRNPLLDTRDDKHLKFNEKLMGNEPSNM